LPSSNEKGGEGKRGKPRKRRSRTSRKSWNRAWTSRHGGRGYTCHSAFSDASRSRRARTGTGRRQRWQP
jgi:hypothetical protein